MRSLAAFAALGGTVLLASAAQAEDDPSEGDPAEGRRISMEHCTRCHVVGDANPHGGIGSTPSFQLLARRNDWRERFETFYARRPHPVFVQVPDVPRWTDLPSHVEPFTVTLQDIADVVSFIETLEPSQ